MKNIIEISQEGEQLISSIDINENTLYINNTLIPESQYIGSGTYTTTVEGHSISIVKAANNNGNLQLIRLGEYSYSLLKAAEPGAKEKTTVTITVGSTTTGNPGTNAHVSNSGDEVNAVFDFVIPRGATGATGNGIASISLNADYTLTIVYTDGTSYTTASVRGERGEKGNTGDPAGFGNVTASVDNNTGTPSVEVTTSGSDTSKNFDFAFHNLKGVKGDPFTFEDFTPEQIENLKSNLRGFYKKSEAVFTTTSASTSVITIPINDFRSTDILFVDVNGLDLIYGTDYTLSGNQITLTTPITTIGTDVHFVALRLFTVTTADYAALKGDPGDVSDVQVNSSSIVSNGIANIVDMTTAEITAFINELRGN